MDIHQYVLQRKIEQGRVHCIIQDPEAKVHPKASLEVPFMDDEIVIAQAPNPDPFLAAEPDLAVAAAAAVELITATTLEAKAAPVLQALILREVLRLVRLILDLYYDPLSNPPDTSLVLTNRGTAYILYYDPADAEAAIAHMHEAQLDGAILNVSIVLPRRKFSRSPPPASTRGNGSRLRYGRGPYMAPSSPPRRHGGGRPTERHDIYRPQSASRSRSPVRSRSYSRSRSPPLRRDNSHIDSRHRRRRSPSYSSYGHSSRSRSPNRDRGRNRY
ncbi:hypothetical protein N7457_003080 [Penicillium paradoxum]|uniref:uncharacterized protein n=1 Tax=Penicillium paradoxum TaxID=176176 RepID=UPI0025473F3B|nr:uncharacterized protein N7457_003080 [Penicillium paradoxum]KAJ5788090.1 hypothetical protein N7457_003080 [Penicillium paradoxum]